MTNVFFDGNCPICKREINFYKKLEKSNKIVWYDISKDKKSLTLIKKTKKECLKKLHVLNKKGDLKVGVDAFITIWKEIKYFKILAVIISFKPVKKILNYLYNHYAINRFNKLYGKRKKK